MTDRKSGPMLQNAMSPKQGAKRGAARFAPVEKPKRTGQTLRRLIGYFSGEKKRLLSVFSLVALNAVVALLIPYQIGRAVDAIGLNETVQFPLLINVLLILGIFYVTDAFLTFLQGWMMAAASQKIVMRLRETLFRKLQKLPIAFFDRNPNGEVMSRLTNDIENVEAALSQSAVGLMNDGLSIVGALILMIWISPPLTLASLITVPLVLVLTNIIASRTSKLFARQQCELGRLNGLIEESVSGLKVVKAFSHENEAIAEFSDVNRKLNAAGMKAQIWSGYLMPMMNVINNLGFTAVATVGGYLAVRDMISVGMIAGFLTYSRLFTRPLINVAAIFNTLQSAIAGAERVFEIVDEREEAPDSKNAKSVKSIVGDVRFENVSFSYTEKQPVLSQISFHVRPHETVALVGPTGSGKTTIINLLIRFYECEKGSIKVDGTDIRNYRRSDYRDLFGIVPQDPYLFRGTIADNIRYGKPGASDRQVQGAAKAAGADPFIRRLARGYRTMLDDNGDELSAGQKQLLTIARAFLSDPAILIMDEATSRVDTHTERAIQQAMDKLSQSRTSFVIAHRLSTVRHADKLLVIDGGRIVEQGTHDELLAAKGFYYDMYREQFASAQD